MPLQQWRGILLSAYSKNTPIIRTGSFFLSKTTGTWRAISLTLEQQLAMSDAHTHHLIYGTLTDFLTGDELTDTDDERLRQELARMMVQKLGYQTSELEPRRYIDTLFTAQFVRSTVELTVRLEEKSVMVIRYAPGSLVTRERATIAAARVLEQEYQIPLAVITNGQDAELLDSENGEVLATGMEAIPTREQLVVMLATLEFRPALTVEKRERELRILNAFDVEICCRNS